MGTSKDPSAATAWGLSRADETNLFDTTQGVPLAFFLRFGFAGAFAVAGAAVLQTAGS